MHLEFQKTLKNFKKNAPFSLLSLQPVRLIPQPTLLNRNIVRLEVVTAQPQKGERSVQQ